MNVHHGFDGKLRPAEFTLPHDVRSHFRRRLRLNDRLLGKWLDVARERIAESVMGFPTFEEMIPVDFHAQRFEIVR